MKRANDIRGRIEGHGQGLGTADEAMVRERAREIAITNGRKPDQYTEADLDQARQELQASPNAPGTPSTGQEEEMEFTAREGLMEVSTGRAARTKRATDEQALPEQLIAEGLEEAAHQRAVEGNIESRRKDENYEDQLPPGEP